MKIKINKFVFPFTKKKIQYINIFFWRFRVINPNRLNFLKIKISKKNLYFLLTRNIQIVFMSSLIMVNHYSDQCVNEVVPKKIVKTWSIRSIILSIGKL